MAFLKREISERITHALGRGKSILSLGRIFQQYSE